MKEPNLAKFQQVLKEVALVALENAEHETEYTPADLENVVLIMFDVFMNLAFKKGLNEEQAEQAGSEMHAYMLKYTGVDLKDLK